MNARISTDQPCSVAKRVGPEDLMCGDFVAMLYAIGEYPSFLWLCDASVTQPHEPVRVQWRPSDAGAPLKIKALCLPFVLVKQPGGDYRNLDVRQCSLVRLAPRYARIAWKKLRKQSSPCGRKRRR